MSRIHLAALFFFSGLPVVPLLAQQTQIGGWTCNSSTVNGSYAVAISGRKITTAGAFTNVFQSIGSATFDGQSKVAIALTTDTNVRPR